MEVNRREFLTSLGAGTMGLLLPEEAEAYTLTDRPSPKRKKRADRRDTRFIVLHTTEANGTSSLNSLTKDGKANYVVDTDGKIYRIMKDEQIAVSCGRSMWNGLSNLDEHAISIENVGYHTRELTPRQYSALKEFLQDLKRKYSISDERVMPHSQVAYGKPNRWFRRSHRGRKRCGMLFATEPVREKLGLSNGPSYDPDIAADRLVAPDDYLAEVLYGPTQGKVRVAGKARPQPTPIPTITEPAPIPTSEDDDITVRTIEKGQSLWTYTGNEFDDPTTIYMLKDGRIRRGDELKRQGFNFNVVPGGTRVAVGYVYGGHVKPGRTAYSVVGKNWNMPSTLYIYNGTVLTGDQMSDNTIPKDTLVLFRK